jgi:aldehyde:ferredoxin oxidoreductase
VLGFVRSLAEAGLIPSDRGTPEIDYASLASMEAWARKIAFREGLGDVLAGGFEAIINAFGPDSVPYAPYISRGMHPYVGPKAPIPYDLFGTQELGQALDPRGPHVGAGGSPTYFARRPLEVFPKHLRRMGVPEEAIARIVQPADSPAEENLKIGSLLKYSHRWFSTLGSMGICARAQINRWYDWETCAQFYEAVTGIETSLEALSERVERIWTLYRLLNIREGMTRADDSLPGKWFEEPTFKNYLTGETLSREDAEQMVSDYYQEWGWDPETGTPSNEYLRNLGLELCLP